MQEERLAGGFVNEVVRIGTTVRRAGSQNSAFSRRLLRYLDERGWTGAPRFLGLDELGRETLTYIEGSVPTGDRVPPAYLADAALAGVARLVRELHDLTAGTDLAGADEVVCHNDLSPKNTVYRDEAGTLMPVALIDWDLAGPGPRIRDVGHMCWKYLDLGPSVTDMDDCARRVRLICDAYGLEDRSELIDAVLWWQEATVYGVETGASDGDPAMIRLRDSGMLHAVRRSAGWVRRHRDELAERLF